MAPPDSKARIHGTTLETYNISSSCLQELGIAEPKIVVWAHNSHVGDARYTDMGRKRCEVNVGQLLRERYGEPDVRLYTLLAVLLVTSRPGSCT